MTNRKDNSRQQYMRLLYSRLMQVENPRRLLLFLAAVVAVVFAGYWFLLRSDGDKPQDIVKTVAPADVSAILTATGKEKFMQIVEKGSPTGTKKQLIDMDKKAMAVFYNGKLSVLQKNKAMYQLSGKCFFKLQGPIATPPTTQSIATSLLPEGSNDFKYDISEDGDMIVVNWTLESANPKPKAVVKAGKESKLIKSASFTSGKVTTNTKVTYPDSVNIPAEPKNICK
jgi:hypothetical protein